MRDALERVPLSEIVILRSSGFFLFLFLFLFHFPLLLHQILVTILEHVDGDDPHPLAAAALDFNRLFSQLGYKVAALAPLVNSLLAIKIFEAAFALNRVIG